MSKPFAWSWSGLQSWETCPRRHHLTKIAKTVPDPPGESAVWGTTVHRQVEERIKAKTPLPSHLGYVEPIVQAMERQPGVLRSEQKLALNRELQPVTYFAKDVYLRAIGDVIIQNGTKAFAGDFKTGAVKHDDGQLKLQSAVMFASMPEVQDITVSYIWLKSKQVTTKTVTRNEVPIVWTEFLPRARRMEEQIAAGQFDPRPSGLCGKWCPCTGCEFNGRR